MGTTSGSDSDRGVHEKEVHHVQKSSLDRSDEEKKAQYDDKLVVAGTVQGPDSSDDTSSDSVKDVFDAEAIDPVLSKKMALVNKAIDKIGMTSFQWKMFFLNGFGYAVDSVR
jgi:hypothetical protein